MTAEPITCSRCAVIGTSSIAPPKHAPGCPGKLTEFREYVAGCNGTLHWHKFTIGNRYVATDGAKMLADTFGAWWLLEAIASYFYKPEVRREPFQVWTLREQCSHSDALLICDDGNGKELATQRIPYTDFPRELMPFRLYCEATDIGGAKFAIMLPEER